MMAITQAGYDAITPADDTFYVVTDATTTYREAIAISDNTTALTTGIKMTWYSPPYAITITDAEASLLTAATGAGLIVDIHDDGTTQLWVLISWILMYQNFTLKMQQHSQQFQRVLSDGALAEMQK